MSTPQALDYRSAGVDIDAGNQLVENIKGLTKKTHGPQVLSGIGNFAALYALNAQEMKEPVLVSCTDGVGTKLKLALDLNIHHTVGIDLVAMSINDLIVMGATPLFFLDYFATGKLDVSVATEVIRGITEGCLQAEVALVGGETAEMPGFYTNKDYDIAGFAVGVVDKAKIIDGSQVSSGDALIALPSSGPHSNGYSLIRKIIDTAGLSLQQPFGAKTLGETLLTPTTIYSRAMTALFKMHTIHACAHITGGGLTENLPRVLPTNTQAVIDTNSWQFPPIFELLQEQGHVEPQEMLRTFNCGVGMVLVVPHATTAAVISCLNTLGHKAWQIGHIEYAAEGQPHVIYR